MAVKFFDGPIADSELANLAEMSADSLDAPTTEFKRQPVPTAPMPFRPGVQAATETAIEDRAALTRRVERPRAKSRTAQWVLAAAIVIGLGFAGHYVGAHVSAAHAAINAPIAVAQPVVTNAPTELVAAPVVRITTKAPDVIAEAAPVAKPKVHHRREAPVAADPTPTAASEETTTEIAKADTKPAAKSDTKTDPKVATEEAPKPAETADSELMKQAAETLSNANLDSAP